MEFHLPSSLSLNVQVCVYSSLNSQKKQLASNGDFIEIHMISIVYTIYLPVGMLFSCSKFMQSYFLFSSFPLQGSKQYALLLSCFSKDNLEFCLIRQFEEMELNGDAMVNVMIVHY